MLRITTWALFVCLLFPEPSQASGAHFYSGSDLVKLRTQYQRATREDPDTNYREAWKFRAFVIGVHDIGNGALFCTEEGVGELQTVALVAKFMEDNPQHWNLPAAAIVALGLTDAFPCGSPN